MPLTDAAAVPAAQLRDHSQDDEHGAPPDQPERRHYPRTFGACDIAITGYKDNINVNLCVARSPWVEDSPREVGSDKVTIACCISILLVDFDVLAQLLKQVNAI